MEAPEPEIVDWPSLLSALFIDSLLVWGPAVAVFLSAPERTIPIALAMVLAALVVNCALYTRGTTLGTYLAGFRLRTWHGQPPGPAHGLLLTLLSFLPVLAIGFLLAASFTPGNNASAPLGRPEGYPLIGERIQRRRFLQAADKVLGALV
ncbi:hypothetical protein [Arthrobacter sp. U41]|uniref:hypothetical protein n=1 Tax=Arthrobacter sp. U41 TaxID=1849032 RepID=UPI0011A18FC9|nr:hypothetical protein [Arthrobacter sp. U41]